MANTITIAGVGSSRTVTVETDESLSDALDSVGISPEDAGLNVEVNGQTVDIDSYPPSDGDQVIVTPRRAKLG
jgi:sulfur carrier protein ThiS